MNIDHELQRIAQQYIHEGYTVIPHPDEPLTLHGLSGVAADLLATRGGETVLVRVIRSRSEVEADPGIATQAERVNARPGWRYDLIVLERETEAERVAERSAEPTEEQLREMFDRTRRAERAGFREMALIYAWGALEAAMRRAWDEGVGRRAKPTELLSTLYANGVISRPEFDLARQVLSIRNQTVHGFVPPAIAPTLIDEVIRLAEKIHKPERTMASSVAG